MKKKILLCFLLSLFCLSGQSQTFSEWFRQKKVQKRYQLKQIAALQVYIQFAKEGYDLVNSGLDLIGRIKSGDLDLHRLFFGSLQDFNPAMAGAVQQMDIPLLCGQVQTETRNIEAFLSGTSYLKDGEKRYLHQVLVGISSAVGTHLATYRLLSTSKSLAMADEERLAHLDMVGQALGDAYAFMKTLEGRLWLLAESRKKEDHELSEGKLW